MNKRQKRRLRGKLRQLDAIVLKRINASTLWSMCPWAGTCDAEAANWAARDAAEAAQADKLIELLKEA